MKFHHFIIHILFDILLVGEVPRSGNHWPDILISYIVPPVSDGWATEWAGRYWLKAGSEVLPWAEGCPQGRMHSPGRGEKLEPEDQTPSFPCQGGFLWSMNGPASRCPSPFCLCPGVWEGGIERGLEVPDQGNTCSEISWFLSPWKYLMF